MSTMPPRGARSRRASLSRRPRAGKAHPAAIDDEDPARHPFEIAHQPPDRGERRQRAREQPDGEQHHGIGIHSGPGDLPGFLEPGQSDGGQAEQERQPCRLGALEAETPSRRSGSSRSATRRGSARRPAPRPISRKSRIPACSAVRRWLANHSVAASSSAITSEAAPITPSERKGEPQRLSTGASATPASTIGIVASTTPSPSRAGPVVNWRVRSASMAPARHAPDMRPEIADHRRQRSELHQRREGRAGIGPAQQSWHHTHMGRRGDRQQLGDPLHQPEHDDLPDIERGEAGVESGGTSWP